MGMLKFEVAHSLPKDEAKKRVEALLGYWERKYGVRSSWSGDAVKVVGRAMGVAIDASFQVTERNVGGEATDPGFLLRAQATKYLQKKFNDYLDPTRGVADLARSDD